MGTYSDRALRRLREQQAAPAGMGGDIAPGGGGSYSDRALRRMRRPQGAETADDISASAASTKPWLERTAQGALDAMLPYSDEIEASMRAGYSDLDELLGGYLPGEPETYDEALADVQSRRQGVAYYAGMPLAFAAPAGLVAGATREVARRGGGRLAQYGTAAATSALEGGLYASGDADPGERLGAVPGGMALGAAAGAAGQRLHESLRSFANRHVARDIDRLDELEMAAYERLASKEGIQLTPAEMSGLPTLMQEQKRLGQMPGVGDDLDSFYRTRAEEQIDPAIGRYFEGLSDVDGGEAAGEMARTAAKRASQDVAEDRAAEAVPIYRKAFEEAGSVDVAPALAKIDQVKARYPEGGEIVRAADKAKRLIGENTDLQRLHGVKRELDQMISSANPTRRLGPETQAQLVDIQEALVSALDDASPDYARARGVFEDLSPGVDRVREGAVGAIAGLKDTQLKDAAGRLFQPGRIGPRAAKEAKDQLQAADPDAWQAIKRSFLEEKWLEAGKETLEGGPRVNAGAIWRQKMLGDPKQRRILKAVMEPEEFQALEDLGKVLQATGRVKRMGSDTASLTEADRLAKEAAKSPLSHIVETIKGIGVGKVASMWDERRLIEHSEAAVKAITSPDGVDVLRELKRLKASDSMWRAVVGQMITQQAARVVEADDSDEGEPGTGDGEPSRYDFHRDDEGQIIGATPVR